MVSLSDHFQNLQNVTGLTSDQLTYVISLFCLFWISHVFRIFFGPKTISAQKRHFISFAFGVVLLSIVFGREALHLLGSSLLAFVLIKTVDAKVVHIYIMVEAMLYLSFIHIWRMLIQDDTYVIDISGPLMLATIKITYVGYGIHDGQLSEDKKNENNVVMKKQPTLLEYLGYIFNFSSVFCGPPMEFQDYMDFIEGKQYKDYKESLKGKEPSPWVPSVKKFVLGYLAVGMYGAVASMFDPKMYGDKAILEDSSLLYKIFFAEVMVYHHKFKYISAFVLGESICNAAGCGFSGVDDKGNAQWNKLTVMNPLGIEFGRNIRELVECWNIQVNIWLKKCIYSRLKLLPLLGTWAFSALWHGFYPGYYAFFISLGVGSFITRKIRRKIRPWFLQSKQRKLFYDVITWLVTRLIINFYLTGFVTLNLASTFMFWRSSYNYGHYIYFVGLILICILPDLHYNNNNNNIHQNGSHEANNEKQKNMAKLKDT